MTDYISCEAALEMLDGIYDCNDMVFRDNDSCVGLDCGSCRWRDTRDYIRDRLTRIPAADVAPVVRGRWIEVEVKELAYYKLMIASMRCDQCGRYHNEVYHYGNPTEMAKYCGFCGAFMGKDGDGDV